MAAQRPSPDLSPQLRAVLTSLNVDLESELNRYRRNRFIQDAADIDDTFADLEQDEFDLPSVESAAVKPVQDLPVFPPPVPPNKKIVAASQSSSPEFSQGHEPGDAPTDERGRGQTVASNALSVRGKAANAASSLPSSGFASTGASENEPIKSDIEAALSPLKTTDTTSNDLLNPEKTAPQGYLASSEKLIESLQDVPSMPAPVDTTLRPKRKTVSLLAGACLGLFGLVAGLGASYLMSNPLVAQQLANRFNGKDATVATASKSTFDPPGPDLSSREFIDIKMDNLSSLEMPQSPLDPSNKPDVAVPLADASSSLPPISSQPSSQPGGQTATAPSASQLPVETQAVVIPAGSNYYITAPFSTEQGLIEVRQTVDEAFVRRFADGSNRIQLAAFDNLSSAQQFIEELKVQGVTGQIYGPTAE